jgi:glucose/arabinose dehydrogenase
MQRLVLCATASAFLGTAYAQSMPRLDRVVRNVAYVSAIVNAGDGSNRLFVASQEGEIFVTRGPSREVFLDITDLTDYDGEQGLLGLVFAPDYETSGLFYIQYTGVGDGRTVVAEYQVSDTDPNQANAASARILIEYQDPFTNHNGGDLHFGPDGYLYLAWGDGGDADDPLENGQDLTTLWGKMLRIDPDPTAGDPPDCDGGGGDYSIPSDNPFSDGAGGNCDEIWAYGLRNPWRWSFDEGNLWIADVGQNVQEEVNFTPAASMGGENYGWDIMEGNLCHEPEMGCDPTGLVMPVLTYNHVAGRCSITGGYVYRGTVLPMLVGEYVYGDYCTGEIWAGQRVRGDWSSRRILDTNFFISTFGETETGQLCVGDHAARGAVYCWLPG